MAELGSVVPRHRDWYEGWLVEFVVDEWVQVRRRRKYSARIEYTEAGVPFFTVWCDDPGSLKMATVVDLPAVFRVIEAWETELQ